MPSATKSWVENFDDVALLRITSNDPRRNGRVDLAYFDISISDNVAQHQWCTRRGEPYSFSLCTSLANFCAHLYGKGIFRKEPDCDFTSSNYYASILNKDQFINTVASKNKRILKQNKFNKRVRYIKQDEWINLEVQVQCRRTITIKVCSRHAHLVPQKLFLSHKNAQLCIWPTREKRNRRRQLTLARYLLQKVNNHAHKTAHIRTDGSFLDYRIRVDNSGYTSSTTTYIQFHPTQQGTVIEVGGNEGAYDRQGAQIWHENQLAYRYPRGTLIPSAARRAYVLVTDEHAEIIKETGYLTFDNYCFRLMCDDMTNIQLPRFIAKQAGLAIENILVPSRNTATYEKALNKGVAGYARRAALENQIISEQVGPSRMYTKPRFITRRNVYADVSVELTLPNGASIYALDCRPEHLVVGTKGRAKLEAVKPLSKNELAQVLSMMSYKPTLREDI